MRWLQAWQLYDKIPMKHVSVLPDEGFPVRNLVLTSEGHLFAVYCKPKRQPGESLRHRVTVKCGCGREFSFGRMNQHWPVCPARKEN